MEIIWRTRIDFVLCHAYVWFLLQLMDSDNYTQFAT